MRLLDLACVRFRSERFDQHPASFCISFEDQFVTVGLEDQGGNRLLFQLEYFLFDRFLPLLRFFGRKFHCVQVETKACEH